jgi:hypothetical protein
MLHAPLVPWPCTMALYRTMALYQGLLLSDTCHVMYQGLLTVAMVHAPLGLLTSGMTLHAPPPGPSMLA